MAFNLSKAAKATRVMNAVAAGTTDQNSTAVDMTDFDGVCFITSFGTITANAVTNVHLETSSDNSTFNDLAGTSITVADSDDNQVVVSDLVYPRERYIRAVVDRGTADAVIDGIVALQYLPGKEPTTHDSTTVVGSELHHAPAEGTP